jgi:hypothetical protein
MPEVCIEDKKSGLTKIMKQVKTASSACDSSMVAAKPDITISKPVDDMS